jgi:hypothetical protein
MSKLGSGPRAFDVVTQSSGRTSYSYAGGETRRDLASGSREALAEALWFCRFWRTRRREICQEEDAEKMKVRLLRCMVMYDKGPAKPNIA